MTVRAALLIAILSVSAAGAVLPNAANAQAKPETIPRFEPQPFWPKPLPENWILGQVSGIAVDKNDHIWIVHRPATLLDDEKGAQKDPPRNQVLQGGPGGAEVRHRRQSARLVGARRPATGSRTSTASMSTRAGNVWVGGNNDGDQILQFSPDGKFIQQVGKDDGTKGSSSTTRLGRPAHMMTDDAANEIYVADGYGNRRIVVFDTKTGAYKRHWGAGGTKTPHDDKLPAYSPAAASSPSFHNPVHCVRLSNDGLVYVCDRTNNRIQVFRKDGSYVKEFKVAPETLQNGSVWDLVLSGRPAAAFHLRRRRRQRPDHHHRARERRAPHPVGPPRPPARPVQVGAQHRDRQQGQPLHRRGRLRPPRAKIPESRVIKRTLLLAAVA